MRIALPLAGALLLCESVGAYDCNQNGIEDATDLKIGSSADCNRNSVPDECDLAPRHFSFSLAEFETTDIPVAVKAADLDGDGRLALALALSSDREFQDIVIYGGRGDGTFTRKHRLTAGRDARALVAADLDADEDDDLAFLDESIPGLIVLKNDGQAGLLNLTPLVLEPGLYRSSIAPADLDGDGRVDLVVSGLSAQENVLILHNRGNATFRKGQALRAGKAPLAVATADFDGDGDVDFVTANWGASNFSLLRNRGDGTFAESEMFPPEGSEQSSGESIDVAAADLDADGDFDLIASLSAADQVWVQLNDGRGSFGRPLPFAVGDSPRTVTTGDVDGDRNADVLVLSRERNALAVLINDGTGSLAESLSLSLGTPLSAAVADLNGDGRLDLAAGLAQPPPRVVIAINEARPLSRDCDSNQVPDECDIREGKLTDCNRNLQPDDCDIALGVSGDCNGNGVPDDCDLAKPLVELNGPETFPLEESEHAMTAADLDGDGSQDLAVANSLTGNVSVLRNLGDGAFRERVNYGVRGRPRAIQASDLDGDGDIDLLTAGVLDLLDVLRNQGNSVFLAAESYTVGTNPSSLTVTDLNGDGSPDVVTTNRNTHDLSVLLNDGSGRLSGSKAFPAGRAPVDAAAGDLDGDGDVDLAAVNSDSSDVSLLLQREGVVFSLAESMPLNGIPLSIAALDVEDDGALDLAIGFQGSGLVLLRNTGSGGFAPPAAIQQRVSGFPDLLAVDLDGDRRVDLLSSSPQELRAFYNDGQGGFSGPGFYYPAPGSTASAADLNGDALPDLVVAGSVGRVLFNRGDRTFAARGSYPSGRHPRAAAHADIDGDGDADLALADQGADAVILLLNDGKGGLDDSRSLGAGREPRSLVAADLDGDGDPDLAVANSSSTHLSLLLNRGRGSFSAAAALEVGRRPFAVDAGDLDVDGDTDLAVLLAPSEPELGDGYAALLPNDGEGDIGPPIRLAPLTSFLMRVADLDGDHRTDLVLPTRQGVNILTSDGVGGFALRELNHSAGTVFPIDLATGDLEGDGDVDLAVLHFSSADAIAVFRNAGEAGFERPVIHHLTWQRGASSLTLADLDGEGHAELIITNSELHLVAAMPDPGSLGSMDPRVFRVGVGPIASITVDLDGDQRLDLAVLNEGSAEVSVLLNRSRPGGGVDCNGDALPDECRLEGNDCNSNEIPDECDLSAQVRFAPRDEYPLFGEPLSMAAPDLDGDLKPDLAMTVQGSPGQDSLLVYLNQGAGTFSRLGTYLLPRPLEIHAGDLDGDGDSDLLGASFEVSLLFPNDGKGVLGEAVELGRSGVLYEPLVDLDGDRDLDLVFITRGAIEVHLNHGNAVFELKNSIPLTPTAWRVHAADLNGDGKPDLVVVNRGARNFAVLMNQGGAEFPPPKSYPVGGLPIVATIAELDGDSHLDVAVAVERAAGYEVLNFHNLGDGEMKGSTTVGLGERIATDSLLAIDVDGDARVDLVTEGLRFYRNLGLGRFSPVTDAPGGRGEPLAADFDQDGAVDFASPSGTRSFNVHRNRTRPPRSRDLDADGVPDECEPDCNQNGKPDSYDLASGKSGDCNRNGALDACDIAQGRSRDGKGGATNGVPDECEPDPFRRGDSNGDGWLDVSDGLCVIAFLFVGGSTPTCMDAADANGDGAVDCSDGIFVLGYLFLGESSPPPPGPPPAPCGHDPDHPGSPGNLGCDVYSRC